MMKNENKEEKRGNQSQGPKPPRFQWIWGTAVMAETPLETKPLTGHLSVLATCFSWREAAENGYKAAGVKNFSFFVSTLPSHSTKNTYIHKYLMWSQKLVSKYSIGVCHAYNLFGTDNYIVHFSSFT